MRPCAGQSRKALKRHQRKIRRRKHPSRFLRYDDDTRLTDLFPPNVVRMLLS